MRIDVNEFMGKKNNKLTVIGYIRPEAGVRVKLKCLCDCGNTVFCLPYQFSSGAVKSCGCLPKGKKGAHTWDNRRKTHGLSKHPFYKKWNDMVRRCYDPKEPAYKKYGARGVTVCEEWRKSPEQFIAWCEETHPGAKGLTIDRIDGSKGYCPENCRWATQLEQVHNIKTNRFIVLNGEKRCITEWCSILGISPGSVYKKVHKGMSFEAAIKDTFIKKKK